MVLAYLRNQQFGRYADILEELEDKHSGVGYRNPDYWEGRIESRADLVYTDFPAVIAAYREAGIEVCRLTDAERDMETLAQLKGASLTRKGGGWIGVEVDGAEKNFRDESKLRSYLEGL